MSEDTPRTVGGLLAQFAYLASERKRAALARSAALDAIPGVSPANEPAISARTTRRASARASADAPQALSASEQRRLEQRLEQRKAGAMQRLEAAMPPDLDVSLIAAQGWTAVERQGGVIALQGPPPKEKICTIAKAIAEIRRLRDTPVPSAARKQRSDELMEAYRRVRG